MRVAREFDFNDLVNECWDCDNVLEAVENADMEDDLMIKFGSDRMKSIMTSLGIQEDQAISNKMISNSLESAQKKVEALS